MDRSLELCVQQGDEEDSAGEWVRGEGWEVRCYCALLTACSPARMHHMYTQTKHTKSTQTCLHTSHTSTHTSMHARTPPVYAQKR